MHNELGDGWLWVTSQTTQESGIICQDLVEDLVGGATEKFLPETTKSAFNDISNNSSNNNNNNNNDNNNNYLYFIEILKWKK